MYLGMFWLKLMFSIENLLKGNKLWCAIGWKHGKVYKKSSYIQGNKKLV
jgi:hypothetical protein